MDRPTCKTCPYWHEAPKPDNSMAEGDCRRRGPQFAACDRQYHDMTQISWDEWCGTWPGCDGDDWCGEHPDFPAYIAGLKPKPEPPPHKSLIVRGVRERRAISKALAENPELDMFSLTRDHLMKIKGCGITSATNAMQQIEDYKARQRQDGTPASSGASPAG